MPLFEKGKSGNPNTQISGAIAEDYQRRSVESRLRNKRGKELLQALLEQNELDPKIRAEIANSWGVDPDDMKKEVAMHARQVDKAIRKADTAAYNAIVKAAGYDEVKVNLNGANLLNLVVNNEKDAEALAKIINREQ